MKVLTVKRPFEWAILYAGKDSEIDWRTHYQSPLIIHACAAMHFFSPLRRLPRPSPESECLGSMQRARHRSSKGSRLHTSNVSETERDRQRMRSRKVSAWRS